MFISEEFWFDNIFSKDMGVLLINMESDIITDYGLPYSGNLEAENTFNQNPFFKSNMEIADRIKLCFCLGDMYGQTFIWDDNSTEKIYSWLIQDDFKPFVSKDNIELTYYLKATGVTKKFTKNMTGYLEVEFQPYTNYTYKEFIKTIRVNGSKEIKINNSSNTEKEFYYPVLEIKNLGDSDIVIKNTSIDKEPFVLKGLEINENVTIDNLLYIVQTDNGENRFECCNRNWLVLKKGENILKFIGNYEVIIKAKFPTIR